MLQTILEPSNSKLEQASKTIPTPLTHSPRVFYRMGEGVERGPGRRHSLGSGGPPSPIPLNLSAVLPLSPVVKISRSHCSLLSSWSPSASTSYRYPKLLSAAQALPQAKGPEGLATSCEKIYVPLVCKSCLSHFLQISQIPPLISSGSLPSLSLCQLRPPLRPPHQPQVLRPLFFAQQLGTLQNRTTDLASPE